MKLRILHVIAALYSVQGGDAAMTSKWLSGYTFLQSQKRMLVNMSGWNLEFLYRVTTSNPCSLKNEAVNPVPEKRSSIRRVLGGLSRGGLSVLGDRDLDGEGVFWRSADDDDAWSVSFERPRIGSDELPLASDSI